MSNITDSEFINNVEKSLTIAKLTDLPIPFLIINNRLYCNASREQIYGIMILDGTPLSVDDDRSKTKRLEGIEASTIVNFYEKTEKLNSKIKEIVTRTIDIPPILSKINPLEQRVTTLEQLEAALSPATAP